MATNTLPQEPLDRVTTQVLQQKKLFLLVGAVAAAAVLAISLYEGRKSGVQTSANDALFKAKTKLKEEAQKQSDTFRAANPIPTLSEKDEKDKKAPPPAPTMPEKFSIATAYPTGLEALKSVSEKYESSTAGYEANLLLGQMYFEKDTSADAPMKAIQYFQKAADQKLDAERTSVALSQLAYALESQGKKDEALTKIDSALSLSAKSGIEIDLLRQKVRLLQEKGEKAKALATAEQILKHYPNSEHARWAEARKAELSQ